ncbi:cysteine proteinase inhibitor 5-like [Momordica charantia]|uniref:Cysteine proteinase inhibitor 5-like n=1 Tax=Momordica charantia TaxID=3673 RepID=A0A6J1DWG9_MOMCH|nr:cysteine proteinase inhibitor 5-like [Momordica charantia]
MVAAAALTPSPTSTPVAAAEPHSHKLGDYETIKDVNDPFIHEIGRYACIEYNRIHRNDSKFTPHVYENVVEGKEAVVAGTNYKLVLKITINKQSHNYEVIVYDRPWDSHRELTSFRPLLQH